MRPCEAHYRFKSENPQWRRLDPCSVQVSGLPFSVVRQQVLGAGTYHKTSLRLKCLYDINIRPSN